MANNTYNVNQLVPGSATVTVTDDGSGNDWLVITAIPNGSTSIDLGYTNNASGNATQASGFYFTPDNVGHRLIVNGTIENVRGSNGIDEIQGNQVANILYGDQAATGSGLGDTIDADRGNDTVYGGSGNDTVTGDLGNDRLYGDAGDDSISGGDGTDTVNGGLGRDSLDGGADRGDILDYSASNAAVVVNITFGVTTTGSGGHAAGDRIYGFTNVTGSAFADTISDTDKGTLAFGYNENTFRGGNGNDRLNLGGGNDKGYGGSGSDRVYGEDGNDGLFGDGNADSLYGGKGKDTLDGGDGADRFIFSSATETTTDTSGRDKIVDFSGTGKEGDKINLSAIDAKSGTSANEAFKFIGDDTFTKEKGELRYKQGSGNTIIEGDTNGDGKADFAIELSDVVNLKASDFIL